MGGNGRHVNGRAFNDRVAGVTGPGATERLEGVAKTGQAQSAPAAR
jgi:hypothetical protein